MNMKTAGEGAGSTFGERGSLAAKKGSKNQTQSPAATGTGIEPL